MVDRKHYDVLRDIRKIADHLAERKNALSEFFLETSYEDKTGRILPSYRLTKKGCERYTSRMTGEKGNQFAVDYIERFNEMENHIKQNQINTTQFSPELQALIGIEQRQNEQDKRLETVEKRQ